MEKGVLYLGVPSGLQNAIFAIANLFVQSGVNSFDAIMVSGNAAAANADNLIYKLCLPSMWPVPVSGARTGEPGIKKE